MSVVNIFYLPAIDATFAAGVNWGSADIRALLVDSTYVADAAHDFLNDIGSGARIGSAVALAGKSFVNGVFSWTNPITFVTPPADRVALALVLYVHTGTESTSRLLRYFVRGFNLPLTTNGQNVLVYRDTGPKAGFRVRLV